MIDALEPSWLKSNMLSLRNDSVFSKLKHTNQGEASTDANGKALIGNGKQADKANISKYEPDFILLWTISFFLRVLIYEDVDIYIIYFFLCYGYFSV